MNYRRTSSLALAALLCGLGAAPAVAPRKPAKPTFTAQRKEEVDAKRAAKLARRAKRAGHA